MSNIKNPNNNSTNHLELAQSLLDAAKNLIAISQNQSSAPNPFSGVASSGIFFEQPLDPMKAIDGIFEPAVRSSQAKLRKLIDYAVADSSGEGFSLLGKELCLPIAALLDLSSLPRKMFVGTVLHPRQKWEMHCADARSKFPATFDINVCATMNVMSDRLYDNLERMQDTVMKQILRDEETFAFKTINENMHEHNKVEGDGAFTANNIRKLLVIAKNIVELPGRVIDTGKPGLIVDKFVVSDDVLPLLEPHLDTTHAIGEYRGKVLGTDVFVSSCGGVPPRSIYAMTAAPFLGEMGIRQELKSEYIVHTSPNAEKEHGWDFRETVGFGLRNPYAVSLITQK
jgi:hypothetical protein